MIITVLPLGICARLPQQFFDAHLHFQRGVWRCEYACASQHKDPGKARIRQTLQVLILFRICFSL